MRRPLRASARVLTAMVLLAAAAVARAAAAPLTVEDCVRVALDGSARIEEAQAKVRQWEARLAEVESLYYPKLFGTTYVTPMFTVNGGVLDFERRWKKPGDWGPYAHLQATLALPLYSFGRVEAGERAAAARAAVERAQALVVKNSLALEVKKLFYLRLYALSMLPPLRSAASTVNGAIEFAEEAFEEGTGEVTQTDLAKLRFAQSEVEKYLVIATEGAALAVSALKHAMGIADDADVQFAGQVLPELPAGPEIELAAAIVEAAARRPEWTQVNEGKAAALALEQAERLANAPVVFAAGMLTADWTPQRDDAPNPYVYDPYNQVVGGVGVGLQFNLDPAMAAAKTEGARAVGEEVDALARFAKTGIPLQVKKAHGEVLQHRRLAGIADRGVAATKKWLAFAAAAYTTGTGDARDVLEGLAAYLQARRGHFESVQSYFTARAELDFAVGRP